MDTKKVEEVQRMVGQVKWYDAKKCFGFLSSGGQDYFVHQNQFRVKNIILSPGQRVSFVAASSAKGMTANDVVQG